MLKQTDLAKLNVFLEEFGLNAREASIYLELLQSGASTIQELARASRQNRVTVHSAVEQLIKKGFIVETRQGKRRLVVAEKPAVLQRLLQEKRHQLALLEPQLGTMTKLLAALPSADRNIPSVRLYEDIYGFKHMLEETLATKNEVLVFSYVNLLAELLGFDYLERYFKQRAEKDIKTRLIFPPGEFANRVASKAEKYNIQIRYLPPELVWQSGIFAWDNSIALLSYTAKKLTCTIIENKDIADFYRRIIFELCWKQAGQK